MKKVFLYFSFFIFHFSFTNAQPLVDVTPPVKSVTVYQSGAVVTNETKVSLVNGKTTVVFHGLPSRIDVQSIQLASTGDLTILSVSSHEDYLNISKKIGKIRLWQDSLDALNENLEKVKNGIDILEDSKKMLDNNRTVGGVNTGTTVTNLKPMYDYYVHQVSHIDDSLITLRKKKKVLDSKIQKIEKGMREWRSQTDTLTSEVEAIVSSDHDQSVSFKLSYLIYDAGWSTLYDLRVKGTKDPAQLAYKANVYQHTGEDWSNIDLTLSTANPRVSQTAPELMPWYLRYYIAYSYGYANGAGAPA
ncbi:MAG TPA: mucoidy inhibitor MuiA family protein, partial [Bacteroidia bacterium]|nr:mucoidy inhibitor MuiA family protein [Bacteroidia bacterium]